MKLAQFMDAYGKEIYVNPDRVTFIRESGDRESGESTTINFSEEHTVSVKMKVGAVASTLLNAEKL